MIFVYAILTGCLVVTAGDLLAVAQFQPGWMKLILLALAIIALAAAMIPGGKLMNLIDNKDKEVN